MAIAMARMVSITDSKLIWSIAVCIHVYLKILLCTEMHCNYCLEPIRLVFGEYACHSWILRRINFHVSGLAAVTSHVLASTTNIPPIAMLR